MKTAGKIIAAAAGFSLLAIYLFVSAPPELPDGRAGGQMIPAESALALLDALEAGQVATLAGLKLEGGARWRLTRAPARRRRPFTP